MKVIIDTSVVVSAALRDRDPESVVLWVVAQSDWQWVVSADILAEYTEVLGRDKFKLTDEQRARWQNLVVSITTLIEVETPFEFPRDPADAKFLACAIAAEADYLITGDRDFTEAHKLLRTTILSVSLFKKLLLDTAP